MLQSQIKKESGEGEIAERLRGEGTSVETHSLTHGRRGNRKSKRARGNKTLKFSMNLSKKQKESKRPRTKCQLPTSPPDEHGSIIYRTQWSESHLWSG